jgi:hypothetical protein
MNKLMSEQRFFGAYHHYRGILQKVIRFAQHLSENFSDKSFIQKRPFRSGFQISLKRKRFVLVWECAEEHQCYREIVGSCRHKTINMPLKTTLQICRATFVIITIRAFQYIHIIHP